MEIVKLKGKPLLNSTIINNNQNINEEIIKNDLIKIDDNNTKNDNHKKEHLIKEKIDLINEQKMLQDLINHHQSLIKKNQVYFISLLLINTLFMDMRFFFLGTNYVTTKTSS
jgi:hypothetical protein